jgi:precorrin-2 dehydrogenase/sirohydrochlorin ferrochelatase
MFPITLDTSQLAVAVIGKGEATHRRLELFAAAGAKHVKYFAEMPDVKEVEGVKVAFVADFDDEISLRYYNTLHALGMIINVEDKRHLCDFHVPAQVRRGDLLLTVSTNGKSPRIARLFRQLLEKIFPEEWAIRLKEIGDNRNTWKREGNDIPALAKLTDELLARKGWLKELCPCKWPQ